MQTETEDCTSPESLDSDTVSSTDLETKRLKPLDCATQGSSSKGRDGLTGSQAINVIVHITVKENHNAQFIVVVGGKHIHTLWNTESSKSCIIYDIHKVLGLGKQVSTNIYVVCSARGSNCSALGL